jgi:hypothetical protein
VSAELVPELGIPYENEEPIALGVMRVVAITIEGVGPLCDVVAVEIMVARTDDDKLGDASPVVAMVVGMEEFPEEVTSFVSIAM